MLFSNDAAQHRSKPCQAVKERRHCGWHSPRHAKLSASAIDPATPIIPNGPFSCGSLPYVPSLRAKSIRTRASATLPLLTEHTEHDGTRDRTRLRPRVCGSAFPSSRLRTVWAKQLSPSGLNRSGFPGGHLVWVKRPRRAPWCGHSSALRPRREGYSRWVQAGGGC